MQSVAVSVESLINFGGFAFLLDRKENRFVQRESSLTVGQKLRTEHVGLSLSNICI
jgi:hypothetical protein